MQKTESVDAVILIECETRLGFTLPWAGVTPPPGIKKRCGTEFTLSTRRVPVRRGWQKNDACGLE